MNWLLCKSAGTSVIRKSFSFRSLTNEDANKPFTTSRFPPWYWHRRILTQCWKYNELKLQLTACQYSLCMSRLDLRPIQALKLGRNWPECFQNNYQSCIVDSWLCVWLLSYWKYGTILNQKVPKIYWKLTWNQYKSKTIDHFWERWVTSKFYPGIVICNYFQIST